MKKISYDAKTCVLAYESIGEDVVAMWVKDESGLLMATPQDKIGSVQSEWPQGIRLGLQEGGEKVDVLHSPNAFIFLPKGREKIEKHREVNSCIEWLPLWVEGVGQCFVCHPFKYVDFQEKSAVSISLISGNVTGIKSIIFNNEIELPSVFLMGNPINSRAWKNGFGIGQIFLAQSGWEAFKDVSGLTFREI